ncbi:hypothetical protein RhiirA1_454652 [Rhizophagus irregularis]|uniref:Uncharacterized protein n=1 Tax=Rhizophagus irregularis TaxID=588596 RepID=A0A2N0RT09_9GLOM|nr:hypothetical protein RhiirA1_459733 [Rhizophagus irregularis]PKC70521.1 hypothetical protein RhiirA1_454652 [Rhizophagus irregularis]CAB4464309.1 unnamed protein product [Rhizophagus irregularis]
MNDASIIPSQLENEIKDEELERHILKTQKPQQYQENVTNALADTQQNEQVSSFSRQRREYYPTIQVQVLVFWQLCYKNYNEYIILSIASSANLTSPGHFFAYDEALETFEENNISLFILIFIKDLCVDVNVNDTKSIYVKYKYDLPSDPEGSSYLKREMAFPDDEIVLNLKLPRKQLMLLNPHIQTANTVEYSAFKKEAKQY